MWKSTIDSKNLKNGELIVGVVYTNDIDDNQSYSAYSVRTSKDLDERIQARLGELNSIDIDSIPLGEYTPTPKEQTNKEEFNKKLAKVGELKQLVTLGIIPDTDPEYVSRLQEAMAAYSESK